jgi:hypothetical protein
MAERNAMSFFKSEAVKTTPITTTTKEDLLAKFDLLAKVVLSKTESTSMPIVFAEANKLLSKMLETSNVQTKVPTTPEVGDFAIFIEGLCTRCQKAGCYPASLDANVTFATHKKNDNGQRGSTPDKPHYRELGQVCKNTGRILIMAQLKHELSKFFVLCCRYLGEEHPENLPFNEKLQDADYPDWDDLLAHV